MNPAPRPACGCDHSINPCNRCGACCWIYSQSVPAYGIYVENKSWKGKGMMKDRCVALLFDDEIGEYRCTIHQRTEDVCSRYTCRYMKGGEDWPCYFRIKGTLIDVPSFSKKPWFNPCLKCNTKRSCSSCELLPVQIEWFIAHARKDPCSEKIPGMARLLKRKIDNALKKTSEMIDPSWARHLSAVLDGIVKGSS